MARFFFCRLESPLPLLSSSSCSLISSDNNGTRWRMAAVVETHRGTPTNICNKSRSTRALISFGYIAENKSVFNFVSPSDDVSPPLLLFGEMANNSSTSSWNDLPVNDWPHPPPSSPTDAAFHSRLHDHHHHPLNRDSFPVFLSVSKRNQWIALADHPFLLLLAITTPIFSTTIR